MTTPDATTISDKKKVYATKHPPPVHSVVTMLVMVAFFVPCFPSFEAIDKVATVETFTNRVFPDLVSLELLVYTRAAFALVILATTLYSVIPANGWTQTTNYLPGSKLRAVQIEMRGFNVLLPYTSWCWNLLGVSFALSAYIAFQAGEGKELPQSLLRAALLIHETAAPSTLLVSFVVSHAIWPNIIRQGGNTSEISSPRTLIWHNANVIMALSEVSLLGGLPVKLGHFAVSPMYGIAYIFVAWSLMHYYWAEPMAGPQVIYFFFDTTLGARSTYTLLILLGVMMAFFGIFATAELLLKATGGGIVVHLAFVILVSAGVCRFKD